MSARTRTRTPARCVSALLLAVTAGTLLGCAPTTSPESTEPSTTTNVPSDALSGEVSVFAAASLEPAFESLATTFTEEHPDVAFSFTYDGSSVLATQILAGAPVDLFASADEANMQKVVDDGLIEGDPTVFATSELVIAVSPGNPLDITDLADLASPALDGTAPVVVLCAPEVPCGTASQTLLARDNVTLTPASEEQNVTAVLTKVVAGEADAGLVYASDVLRAGGDVEGITIKNAPDAAGSYTIAPTTGATSPDAARAFIEFLGSDDAQRTLEDLGFRAP